MWRGLLDLVYPAHCGGCGGLGSAFCPDCRRTLLLLHPPWCERCGAPLAAPAPGLCRRCAGARPPAFGLARSVAAYEGPLRSALLALKLRGLRPVACELGKLLASLACSEVTSGVGTVVPVPLHMARLRSRGFNQSHLIAGPIAAELGARLLPTALRRVRQETPQALLGARARAENVRDAFAPGEPAARGIVLLVDDIYSTGATASACAAALMAAGASGVKVLTLARALLREPRGLELGPASADGWGGLEARS